MTRRISFAIACSLALSLAAGAEARPSDGEEQVTRVFRLQHAEVKGINALLRGVVDVRKTAVSERDQSITVRDSPERLRQVEALLKEWDRPAAAWTGRLVAVTGSREELLGEIRLEDESCVLRFGDGSDFLTIALEVEDLRERSVAFKYSFETRLALPSGVPRFDRAESGRSRWQGRGEQRVVRAATEAQREALAALVGASRPVHEVLLRLSPER